MMHQRKYTLDLLQDTGMMGYRLASTPMDPNLKLSIESWELLSDASVYQCLVGCLIYLTNTRPDITFAVSVVSQFLHAPRTSHLDAVHHILRYLKTCPGLELFYTAKAQDGVSYFTYADYAESKSDRRSTSGLSTFYDIDIPVVQADRHRLAELRSDHKDITERINQSIQLLHSARLAPKSSPNSGSNNQDSSVLNVGTSASSHNVLSGTLSAMDVDVTVSIPFALVDEIAEDSPAAEDGLQFGDQVVKFGNVESGDNLLPKLASEAQTNQGRGIPVVVLRQGALITLTVTPRVWQGRGLLGCHFRIL
ncbi:probable 26S proteasome regulatory subunit p27 [Actinidia eriantha]|uniref:probable 26S proteasome regulatory subunit p27 n=1 Tax=Actinidia eriantha TaxID=165200 RepID=UPI002582FF2B|nr:probable 26S proteasome regulatory subunit p27 [Actinidia eriantha]